MNMTDKRLEHDECKDYGDKYEPQKLSKYEKFLISGMVAMVLALCMICFPLFNNSTTN